MPTSSLTIKSSQSGQGELRQSEKDELIRWSCADVVFGSDEVVRISDFESKRCVLLLTSKN